MSDCHKHNRLARMYRSGVIGYLILQGSALAYCLHPILHMVLRALGFNCP